MFICFFFFSGFIHFGSNVRDVYALTDWMQKIKSCRLSENVEEIMSKTLDPKGHSQSQETDLTTEEFVGPSQKRKRRSSSPEVLQRSESVDTLDLSGGDFRKSS